MTQSRPENSTNVRTDNGGVTLLRAGLGALGRLSPELAARAAEDMFLTPRRPPRPPAEAEALAGAQPFTVTFRNDKLPAWSWGTGPAVLLVHGWEGRGGQLAGLVPWLRAAGLRVITFDAPAHGDAPGRQLTLAEHAAAILAVDREVGPLRAVIAHSFGAASTTVALARGLQVDQVVFIAPMLGVLRSVRGAARMFGLSDAATAAFARRLERRNAAPTDELEPRELAPLMTARLLAVIDEDDRVAQPLDAADVVGRWPAADLVATRGKGHRAILGDPEIGRAAAEFIAGSQIFTPYSEAHELDAILFHRDDRAFG
jgi:hypothetical protein